MKAVLRLSRSLSGQTTAVHLGASRFLTFDVRQRALALHAGLEVPE